MSTAFSAPRPVGAHAAPRRSTRASAHLLLTVDDTQADEHLGRVTARLGELVRERIPGARIRAAQGPAAEPPGTVAPRVEGAVDGLGADAFARLLATLPTTDEVVIDLAGWRVFVNGAAVSLTRQELELLAYLVRNAGRAVSRAELLSGAWGDSDVVDGSRTVDVHVRRLRAKVEPATLIRTVRGQGYRVDVGQGVRLVPGA